MRKLKKVLKLFRHRQAIKALVSAHLSLLEKDGVASALGGLTEEEEEAVRVLAQTCAQAGATGEENGPIVEFGTLFGLTTQLLAETAPSGVSIITVDNFCWNPFGLPPDLHRQFTKRVLRPYLNSGRVRLIGQDSAAFRKHYADIAPRMIFLDADHSYAAVRDEIAWARQMGVRLISGHDYGNQLFGVTRAVDEAFPEGVNCKGMVWWKVIDLAVDRI